MARKRDARTGELETYRSMRDFSRTAEPAGAVGEPAPDGALRFVVQRHRARRLHYDLRFEMGGVLASWAVPRGPTLDPAARRMAVHVEDHPLEYADFEGVIPSGEYGGGDVIVWDRGTWEPHGTDDPVAAVAAGELHADVHGERLRGRLVLVRRGEADEHGEEQWLLLHKRDEHAVEGWDAEDHPTSVVSGRTNDEVKADPDRLWRSDLPAAEASVELHPPVPAPRTAHRNERLAPQPRRPPHAGVMDPDGTFAGSEDTNGKNEALPYGAPPEGLFPDVRAETVLEREGRDALTQL